MPLTTEEVRRVALLARMELPEEELASQAQHLNTLLQHVEILQKLNVEGVEPTSHPLPPVNTLRNDEKRPSLAREEALANAPEARDGCFAVPRIVEDNAS